MLVDQRARLGPWRRKQDQDNAHKQFQSIHSPLGLLLGYLAGVVQICEVSVYIDHIDFTFFFSLS